MLVLDNGIGFNIDKTIPVSTQRGNGVKNMQKRAEGMNGLLIIESAQQSGTALELRVPIA